VNDQVLGHKKLETCWGLNTDSVTNVLRFQTPTHTHVFGHLKTATCGVPRIAEIWISQWFEAFNMVTDCGEIKTFKHVSKIL
jgi:hypothetical protein